MDNENNPKKIPFFGVIKTAFAYGFYGFVSLVALYAISMVFWNNPALYDLFSIYFAQTFVLVLFCHYLAGFFGQIAIYRKYGRHLRGNSDNSGTGTEKIRYYGALSGFFTGCLIILLPVFVIILTSFNSSGYMHTLRIVFSNFMPFVAAGIICGFIGAYIAGALLKRGYLKRDDVESDIREKIIGYGLLALLLLFVPLFFSLAASHLIEPEVIVYGQYDDNTAYLVKTDCNGNIEWESSPLYTAGSLAYYAVLLKNESYALFGYEPSARGNFCTITYMDKNGITYDTVRFLRNNAPPAHVIEIPGKGFFFSDGLDNIVSLDYNGTVTGHYTVPDEYRGAGSPEMVYSGGDSVFMRWGRYCCMMNFDGNFSDVHSYGEYGTSGRPYRMDVQGISESSGGGYLICVNDDDSRELKALKLDGNLDILSERIIGSTHGSCISVFERNESYVIITDDVFRFEDRPSDYEPYFRIYDVNEQYYDIMPGSDYHHSEVFDDSGLGYSMFTVSDVLLSDEKEVFMKRCGYDGECLSSVSVLKERFSDIKIMQTPDGGYLFSYIVGEV